MGEVEGTAIWKTSISQIMKQKSHKSSLNTKTNWINCNGNNNANKTVAI